MRKLTAILFSDIVDFSKQMSKNETQTLQVLDLNTRLHEKVIKQFNGKIIKAMGDGYLSVFHSSVDAVLAGAQLQRGAANNKAFQLRIGIHVGDVVHKKGFGKDTDVYGDGVNIAARIESNAPKPGVWVSSQVAADLENHKFIRLNSAGKFKLKNIPNIMEIFEVSVAKDQDLGAVLPNINPSLSSGLGRVPKKISAALAVMSLAAVAFFGWQWHQDHFAPDTLAILPFEYIGADNSYQYLSSGFTTELSGVLSEVPGIKVLSHTSSVKLASSTTALSEAEADYIVEGSVHYSEDGIKVNVRLLDTDSDSTLWKKVYQGDINDVFNFQASAAGKISEALLPDETKSP